MSSGREDWVRMGETELASRALAGRSEAWNEIARRHTRRVVVTLLARGTSLEHAEDIAQETWLRLVERQRTGRLHMLTLPGLAIAQAHWIEREERRTLRRREALAAGASGELAPDEGRDLDPSDPSPERQALARATLERIESELRRCSPRARQVFFTVYGERGLSPSDAARALGISVQRVHQTLSEVRGRLRHWIDDDPGGAV